MSSWIHLFSQAWPFLNNDWIARATFSSLQHDSYFLHLEYFPHSQSSHNWGEASLWEFLRTPSQLSWCLYSKLKLWIEWSEGFECSLQPIFGWPGLNCRWASQFQCWWRQSVHVGSRIKTCLGRRRNCQAQWFCSILGLFFGRIFWNGSLFSKQWRQTFWRCKIGSWAGSINWCLLPPATQLFFVVKIYSLEGK